MHEMMKSMLISKSKGKTWKQVLLSMICLLTFSACDNELHMLFPEGPAGMSAYEVWVEEVLAGNIDWPKDRTDVNNFFLYLKGEDGKDGNDGKSAYDLWLEEVARGLDNPHKARMAKMVKTASLERMGICPI